MHPNIFKRMGNRITDINWSYFFGIIGIIILFLFIFCLIAGLIILFIWTGMVFTSQTDTYNFLVSNKDYLMQQYFTTINLHGNKYYTDGYFTSIINTFLQVHHYNTNPWYSQQWSIQNLYINATTHTMTFTFFNAGTNSSSVVQHWSIPEIYWKDLLN